MGRWRRPAVVLLLSAGTLAYEILLVRLFAIEQFHHFAYMAIGVAMLGFGTSGTLLALRGRLAPDVAARWFRAATVITAGTLALSPALADRIPVDATRLLWSPGEWLGVAAVYASLALPFAAGALAVLLALQLEPDRPGRVYGASFVGSGLGAAAAVAILWLVTPVRALAAPAVLAAVAAPLALGRGRGRGRRLSWLVPAAAAALVLQPPWGLDITPYKALPQVEAYPDARRVAERASPLGWVVAVDAAAFRHAPGLSLAYGGAFPDQVGLFVDGDLAGAAAADAPPALYDWLPSGAPYAFGPAPRVLVLGAGGDPEVGSALAHGARHVTAVELIPDLARLARRFGRHETRVTWVTADARAFVARTGERFDLVTFGPGTGIGAGAAGVHALNEDFLHTVDAYRRYVAVLAPGGTLAVTRWLSVPPRESVRVILTAAAALRAATPEGAARGLVVLRSWGTVTVLARPAGFAPAEVARLAEWAARRQFDVDWYPGIEGPTVGFHRLDEPTLYRAARAAALGADSAAAFADAYPFAVAPATDARPYPHHFLRAGSLPAFVARSTGGWLPFAEWGYLALAATLVQSVALAAVCLIAPTLIRTRGRLGHHHLPLVAYFGAIGLGYLAAEIALIQQLGLLLGHPVYAVTAVLAVLLVGSGLGSIRSDRIAPAAGWRPAAALAGALALLATASLFVVHLAQPAPLALRALLALAAVAPVAALMGMPFPLGLRVLAPAPGEVAWAWAVNGFASVVAAPLAALLAVELGSPAVLAAAAAAYAVAATIVGARGRG